MPEAGEPNALQELEVQRKHVAQTTQYSYILIGLGLLVSVIAALNPLIQIPGIITGMIIVMAGAWFVNRSGQLRRDYTYFFKRKVLLNALLHIDPSMRIEPQTGLSEKEFKSSQLFNAEPDRMHSEDQVSGIAGKTPFVFSEVHAEYKTVTHTKTGTREEWHDIFYGIIFIADFNKSFSGFTVVRPRDAGSSLSAWFAKHVPVLSSSDELLVELENPEFSKEFVTWSTNQVEARYLLTPAMMERLCELNSRSKQTISISFKGNNLYLAFPLQINYFEPSVFKTLLREDLLNEDLEVVRFMMGIVRDLDLNTRIWGKE